MQLALTLLASLSAQDIVDRVLRHNAFGFENAIAQLQLEMTSERGNTRVRTIEIRSIEKDGQQSSLVRFVAPADVAGTGFLVLENKDREDDQYLYLPAVGKVKRISGSQKNQRFMGTDMTYSDLESQNLKDASLTLLAEGRVGDKVTYVVEAVPRNESEYQKTVTYVEQDSFVPLKVEFFDKGGTLLKVMTVLAHEQRKTGWVVTDSRIENVQKKTTTRMILRALDTDTHLSPEMFTQRELQRG
jgi:hypothetical protein